MSHISTDGGCEFAVSQEESRFFNVGMDTMWCDDSGRDRDVAGKKHVNNSCVVRATASYVLVPSRSPHHHLLQALCYLCCPTTEG